MTEVQGWIIIGLLVFVIQLIILGLFWVLSNRPPAPPEVVEAAVPEKLRPSRPRARAKVPRPAQTVDVIDGVVEHFGVDRVLLLGPSRVDHLVTVRQIAMRLARELTGDTYAEIGVEFGDRTHATVIHGCEQAAGMAIEDVRETVLARWELAGIVPSKVRAHG